VVATTHTSGRKATSCNTHRGSTAAERALQSVTRSGEVCTHYCAPEAGPPKKFSVTFALSAARHAPCAYSCSACLSCPFIHQC